MLYSHTMFNLELWPWPYTNLCQTYTLHIDLSYLTFVMSYLWIPPWLQNIKSNTKYSHTMFNLELWPWPYTNICQTYTLQIDHTWHLCIVICKSHQMFKRYWVDAKYRHTMFNIELWPWPWNDLGET